MSPSQMWAILADTRETLNYALWSIGNAAFPVAERELRAAHTQLTRVLEAVQYLNGPPPQRPTLLDT